MNEIAEWALSLILVGATLVAAFAIRQRDDARRQCLVAERELASSAKMSAILGRSARQRIDALEARANKWQNQCEQIREQLALLPERDPATGRFVHKVEDAT